MRHGFPKPQLLDTVSSTNDYLKTFVDQGSPRVVVARCQTAGRGRHGRRWASEKDRGVYISFLCYPGLPASVADRLNVAAALAVALSLEEVCPSGNRIEIKPPNDVLLDRAKVSGILVETATFGEQISWAIIGIGINLTQEVFSFVADPPPTSLRLAGVPIPAREKLCDILARNLARILDESRGGAWGPIEDAFRSRLWSPDRE